MAIIYHKFKDHQVSADTEILILGTFNPDLPGGPDFFYGRDRNFLWHLLPICWEEESLKEADLNAKTEFMKSHKIDFADFIESLDVEEGQEQNVDDSFIDQHVHSWKNIPSLIDSLPNLKAVYFTRKTFNGISNIKSQMNLVSKKCQEKNIRVCKLETPAKYFSPEKQQQWIDTIVLKNTCLKP